MIIGEIRRYLRDNNAVRVSRSMRDTAYRAMQIKEQLTVKNNCEPTVEEIAKIMDVPKETVVLALEAGHQACERCGEYGRDACSNGDVGNARDA